MILSKRLYLKNNFIARVALSFKQTAISFGRLFRASQASLSGGQKLIGLPQLNLEAFEKADCQQCQACLNYCPTQALELRHADDAKKTEFNLHVLRCISCALCVQACPTGVLRMSDQLARADGTDGQWVQKLNGPSESV